MDAKQQKPRRVRSPSHGPIWLTQVQQEPYALSFESKTHIRLHDHVQ